MAFASRIQGGQIPKASRMYVYVTGQGSDIDAVVRGVLDWLNTAAGNYWLIVVDSVDRDDRWRNRYAKAYNGEYPPKAGCGSMLAMARLLHLRQLRKRWKVNKVNKKQAHFILRS